MGGRSVPPLSTVGRFTERESEHDIQRCTGGDVEIRAPCLPFDRRIHAICNLPFTKVVVEIETVEKLVERAVKTKIPHSHLANTGSHINCSAHADPPDERRLSTIPEARIHIAHRSCAGVAAPDVIPLAVGPIEVRRPSHGVVGDRAEDFLVNGFCDLLPVYRDTSQQCEDIAVVVVGSRL